MERKRLISLVGGLCLTVIGTVGGKAQEVYITVENKSTEDVFLQPEDTTGYRKVLPGTTVMKPVVDGACYYRFVDANSNFYSLYVEPGDTLELLYDGKKLSWSGTKARVQTFLDEHRYIGRAYEPIKTYSQEWVRYNEEKLGELYGLLDRSGLPANFVAVHKEYLRFVFLNLRLNARTMQMFGHGADAGRDYYDFLKTLTFGDSLILCLPKWFSVMKDAMEEMEKQGFLTVSATHYLPIYAERITDEKLRSRFLVEMLRFTLRKGFSDDFNVYVDDVRPLITDRKALDDLAEIEKQYLTLREKNKDLLRGSGNAGLYGLYPRRESLYLIRHERQGGSHRFLVHRLYSLPCGNALLRPSGRNIQRPSGSIPVRFVGYRRPIDGTVEKDGVGERREITCIEFESARRFPFRFYGKNEHPFCSPRGIGG